MRRKNLISSAIVLLLGGAFLLILADFTRNPLTPVDTTHCAENNEADEICRNRPVWIKYLPVPQSKDLVWSGRLAVASLFGAAVLSFPFAPRALI